MKKTIYLKRITLLCVTAFCLETLLISNSVHAQSNVQAYTITDYDGVMFNKKYDSVRLHWSNSAHAYKTAQKIFEMEGNGLGLPDFSIKTGLTFSNFEGYGNSRFSYADDSQMSFNWNINKWDTSRKTINTYNVDGKLYQSKKSEYDSYSHLWDEYETKTIDYDGQERVTQVTALYNSNSYGYQYQYIYASSTDTVPSTEIDKEWNSGQWEESGKVLYTYNGNGYLTAAVYQDWNSGQWVNAYKNIFLYDGDGYLIETGFRAWNTVNSTWEIDTSGDSFKVTIGYDANHNVTSTTTYSKDGNTTYEESKEVFTYDANGNILTSIYSEASSSSSGLIYKNKITYAYSNNLPMSRVKGKWSDTQHTFIDTLKTIVTRNNDHQIKTGVIKHWHPGANSWENEYQDQLFTFYYLQDLAVQELDMAQFKVYPNPARNQVHINTGNQMVDKLQIVNMAGKVVYNANIQSFASQINISTFQLDNGLYFLKIYSGNQIGTKKLEVVHH